TYFDHLDLTYFPTRRSSDLEMATMFGDGSNQGGFMGKLFTAGKRLLTGENLFMTIYTNTSSQKRQVTFAGPYTGKIIPMDLSKRSEEHTSELQSQSNLVCRL